MDKKLFKQFQELAQLWGGYRASRVILTANNYAVFEQLQTPKTAAEVASAVGTDQRATEILLDAVSAFGLLKKTGAKYRNTAIAKKFLLKKSPWYQGDMLRYADFLWKNWSGLDEVVKSGLPNHSVIRDNESFIKGMHNNALLRAKDVVKNIDLRGVKKALDLGGGPGTYSMELARQGISVTLFDLPDTIEIARKIVGEAKVRNINFLRGDYTVDDIGNNYDLVFISQIFHSMSKDQNLALLEKSRNALNPNGKIAIQEFLLEKNKNSPLSGALFSVNMLVNTPSGRSYTSQEMKEWLVQSGFEGVKTKILNQNVVLTATKK
ncbi:MAG: methyltransferase [Nitrospirota bacterium]